MLSSRAMAFITAVCSQMKSKYLTNMGLLLQLPYNDTVYLDIYEEVG